MAAQTRAPSAVDSVLDRYLDDYAALDPVFATTQGLAGHDAELPDLSPEGHAGRADLLRRTLAELAAATPEDAVDRTSIAAARENLGTSLELIERGEETRKLNNIESPVQRLRDCFDLMPTNTPEEWDVARRRLTAVGGAVDGYIASLAWAATRHEIAPVRQIDAAIAQCRQNVGADGFFARFIEPGPQSRELSEAARTASEAYARLGAYLTDELRDRAPEQDAVGEQRYALFSRSFLGTAINLADSYAWGQDELERIRRLMTLTAERIQPGADVAGAVAQLERDPARQLPDAQALLHWMQAASDEAINALADTHFDIPDPVRVLECRIAPTTSGAIYYTGPSEDFSRPGRMWWSIPPSTTTFTTWQERTTVYHEGVPGHHLQIGQTAYRRDLLNRWRRMGCWVSGHGEGWALYAEQLMAELGFLDDPGDYLGMLSGQILRAARVVIDIGVHCGYDAPASVGGGEWNYEKAWKLLSDNCLQPEASLRFELDRYLGWPGQAPSYKLGERAWLELREDARLADGDAFDLKAFHRRALDVGSVGLDALRDAVLDS